jgi:alkylhydroperoxidase family enzyme
MAAREMALTDVRGLKSCSMLFVDHLLLVQPQMTQAEETMAGKFDWEMNWKDCSPMETVADCLPWRWRLFDVNVLTRPGFHPRMEMVRSHWQLLQG